MEHVTDEQIANQAAFQHLLQQLNQANASLAEAAATVAILRHKLGAAEAALVAAQKSEVEVAAEVTETAE